MWSAFTDTGLRSHSDLEKMSVICSCFHISFHEKSILFFSLKNIQMKFAKENLVSFLQYKNKEKSQAALGSSALGSLTGGP
jgi:hypothetical protein